MVSIRGNERITWRYKALIFPSMLCVEYGIAYLPSSNGPVNLPAGVDLLADVVPLWVFGALFLIVGIAGILTILLHRHGSAVFAGVVSMFTLWAAAYFAAFVLGDSRAWLAAGNFLALAGITYCLTRIDPPLWVIRWGSRWTRT